MTQSCQADGASRGKRVLCVSARFAALLLLCCVLAGCLMGTFAMADDGQREPVERLAHGLRQAGLTRDDFWILSPGEGRRVPRATSEDE